METIRDQLNENRRWMILHFGASALTLLFTNGGGSYEDVLWQILGVLLLFITTPLAWYFSRRLSPRVALWYGLSLSAVMVLLWEVATRTTWGIFGPGYLVVFASVSSIYFSTWLWKKWDERKQ